MTVGFMEQTPSDLQDRILSHMNAWSVDKIDRQKAIDYFMATQGWSEEMVIAQVLTPLAASALIQTEEADEESIMCYGLPGDIMVDGQPVPGGSDIDETDERFVAQHYPLPRDRAAA